MSPPSSSGMSVDFNELQGVIFQKIELLMTTAVRTSKPNPTLHTFHQYDNHKNLVSHLWLNLRRRFYDNKLINSNGVYSWSPTP
jgi:hypothetical protein